MKKPYVILLTLVLTSVLKMNLYADPTSDSYRKAQKRGDTAVVFQAQSYLAPPFCYDLNRLHGITFLKTVNGRVVKPAYPFTYQDMSHLKVRKLYDRAGIADMEKSSATELELIQCISDWANKQYGHMLPLPYPAWDAHEVLDRIENGDTFFCTFKAALFVQACNAAGLTARMLGINRKDQDAHTVTDVYSNEYRKWVLVDPWMNCYYERDGIPLSAKELHDSINNTEGIYLVFGENGKDLEYWDLKTKKADTILHAGKRTPITEDESKGLKDYYYDVRVVMRNDHTVHPQSKENLDVDGFMVPYNPRGGEWWGPQLKWADETTPPQITCDNAWEIENFEWPLNEVRVDLKKVSVPGENVVLEAHFSTFTPNFSHYKLDVDGKTVPIDGDVYVWKMQKGRNSLKIASINDVGRSGFPSEFVIEYDPSVFDFSRIVNVRLPNPGFEESDPKSFEKSRTPLDWHTITPNPYRYREFQLDTKVKHSGKCSLRVTPARDPESGVDYAFIVSSVVFDINPAKDVVYSIWLRASEDGTPVDITLHDESKWGLGIYVNHVMVEKTWKRYELKCRLHNEMTKAFTGFKVYSGTVWADDVGYEEVGE
ncbi:MAG: transglutaminase domain-containing protein [Candidatus Latescibacteria bacterium]|nr:transglutaminase domain-containing protein [Candidatus Latescibacterota bacterium]